VRSEARRSSRSRRRPAALFETFFWSSKPDKVCDAM
jgi:hypothetical protein